jgi:hypothetical protein
MDETLNKRQLETAREIVNWLETRLGNDVATRESLVVHFSRVDIYARCSEPTGMRFEPVAPAEIGGHVGPVAPYRRRGGAQRPAARQASRRASTR